MRRTGESPAPPPRLHGPAAAGALSMAERKRTWNKEDDLPVYLARPGTTAQTPRQKYGGMFAAVEGAYENKTIDFDAYSVGKKGSRTPRSGSRHDMLDGGDNYSETASDVSEVSGSVISSPGDRDDKTPGVEIRFPLGKELLQGQDNGKVGSRGWGWGISAEPLRGGRGGGNHSWLQLPPAVIRASRRREALAPAAAAAAPAHAAPALRQRVCARITARHSRAACRQGRGSRAAIAAPGAALLSDRSRAAAGPRLRPPGCKGRRGSSRGRIRPVRAELGWLL